MNAAFDDGPGEDLKLPFHLPTLWASIRRRLPWLLLWMVLAALAGTAGGYFLGKRTYQAETVLRYTPVGDRLSTAGTALQTEQNQVKIVQNLARVRMLLSIPASLEKIGASVQVQTAPNSNLMVIRATWGDGPQAAAIANTLRDVYLDEWLAKQAVSLRLLYDHAAAELRTLESQAAKLDEVIQDLRKRIQEEQEALEKQGLGGNATFRFQRLQAAIQEDQARRANMAELARRESEIQRARQLREQDLISQAEYERAMASYRSQAAVTVDTSQIRAWRSQLDQMAQQMAEQGGTASPTESLLQATLARSMELDLRRIPLAQKVQDIGQALDLLLEVKARNQSMERPSGALSPLAQEGSQDGLFPTRTSLQQVLTRVLTAYGSEGGVFEVVSEAEEPVYPVKSTRKTLALAIFLGLFALGALVLVGLEVLQPRVRSAAEVAQRTDLPVIAAIPHCRAGLALPWSPVDPAREAARRLAQALKTRLAPSQGVLLLVTPESDETLDLVVALLAEALGQRNERVVVIDARVRPPCPARGVEVLCPVQEGLEKGLGDLLAGADTPLGDLVHPLAFPRVLLLPRGVRVGNPEVLAGPVFLRVLDLVRAQATVTLVVGPPVLPAVDAELLARSCDQVILVARAHGTRARDLQRSARRLADAGRAPAGVILAGVRKPFLDLE
ncbi:hypothetical protein KBD49_13750 [Myxococcota bacterium]|nr:hypothetical protein [Myxococcota bacterium]